MHKFEFINGAKCNLCKDKLEAMQSLDSPLAVHEQQGCPRNSAGLAFDSMLHFTPEELCGSFAIVFLWICTHAVS